MTATGRDAHSLAYEAWEVIRDAYRDGDGFEAAWFRLVELFVVAGARLERPIRGLAGRPEDL